MKAKPRRRSVHPFQRRIGHLLSRYPDLKSAIAGAIGQVPDDDVLADAIVSVMRDWAGQVVILHQTVAALQAQLAALGDVPAQVRCLHARNAAVVDQVGALARRIDP